MDVGTVVQNIGTAAAICDTLEQGKPLIERVVTVTGPGIRKPANLLVRIGTPFSEVIAECGLDGKPGKIIMGGPMMGLAQYTDEVPVVKGTSGVVFLSKEKTTVPQQQHCIRCGKCVEVCPVNLVPTTIAIAAEKGRLDIASDFNAADCIECGACAYVCPSKIPLVHLIKQAKRELLCQMKK